MRQQAADKSQAHELRDVAECSPVASILNDAPLLQSKTLPGG